VSATKKDTSIIHSLDKGLRLLEIIEKETYPVTLNILWKKLGWDKSTILRMCNTLERRGYLHKNRATKEYSLGSKIYGLYESINKNIDVQRLAKPYLQRIADETGESTHLAFVFERSVVFIDKVIGKLEPAVNVQIGGREPFHCTSLGKSFLSEFKKNEIESLLELPLKKYTPNSILTLEELMREIETVKEKGYATDNEEYIEGVRCVASPILNQAGKPVAAIGISAMKERLPLGNIDSVGEQICSCAREISRHLGYRFPA
jgi:DNA-binding IclR family transcriptional regulator